MKKLFQLLFFCLVTNIVLGQIDYSKNGQYAVNVLEFKKNSDASRNRNIPIKVHYPLENGVHP